MGHVGERAEGVADGVGDSGAAAVDRQAGEQRRLLHRPAGVDVARHRGGEVVEHEPDRVARRGGDDRVRPAPGDGLDGVDERVETGGGGDVGRHRRRRGGVEDDRLGSSSSPHVHTLRPRPSVSTHVRVTSEPVPAVVGMATIGRPAGSGWAPSA